MNERIKRLAFLCNEEVGDYQYGSIINFNYEKFAELIVRDCIDICNEVQRRYGQYTFTATTVKNEIKQHFGVE